MSRFTPFAVGTGLTRRRARAVLAGPAMLGAPAARAAEDASTATPLGPRRCPSTAPGQDLQTIR